MTLVKNVLFIQITKGLLAQEMRLPSRCNGVKLTLPFLCSFCAFASLEIRIKMTIARVSSTMSMFTAHFLHFSRRNFCFVYKFVEVRVKKEQVVIFTTVFLLEAQSVIVFQEVINCLYCSKICIRGTPLMTPEARFPRPQLNPQKSLKKTHILRLCLNL